MTIDEDDGPAKAAVLWHSEQGGTVLIVDDEPILRMLVTDILEDLGYATIEAGDDEHYNRQAIELWWRNREIIKLVARRYDLPRARQQAIVREHRALIECAVVVAATHATGSGQHVIERLRSNGSAQRG